MCVGACVGVSVPSLPRTLACVHFKFKLSVKIMLASTGAKLSSSFELMSKLGVHDCSTHGNKPTTTTANTQ